LSDERVKQVKEANDIVDVVGSYLSLRPAGGTFKALCPFHDDSRPSFDVDPRRQRYRCWACGKHGDVLSFVQEFEHVSFPEAMEQLARRAGITLEPNGPPGAGQQRGQLLDVMRWAAKQFHECLLEDPVAADAQRYLGERGLLGTTTRQWGLGFAPASGHWLVDLAVKNGVSLEHLEVVGLIAPRQHGPGYYDRFRDRVQFPIRDVRAQVVGFGGRILPTSPLAERGPKYYNSCDTPLFSKSQQLYGIDQARPAAEKAGYLAVVEGYTDVLMAHQMGVTQVVATMGTALNDRHLRQIRRFVPRVVLVFDADAGGDLGVDRALTLFATHDMDLSIAALPAGLDPCDLLVKQGPDPFRRVLEAATDALEFKLDGMIRREGTSSVEGCRRILDAVLGVIALAPSLPGEAGAVKIELMVSRVARRLALKEETVWARLDELRRARRSSESGRPREDHGSEPARSAPASREERRLLEVLLAEPNLVAPAAKVVAPEEVSHPGLRRLLAGLYALSAAGAAPSLDRLRVDLDDAPALVNKAFQLQDAGLSRPDRHRELEDLLAHFRQRREKTARQELGGQLHVAREKGDVQSIHQLLNRVMNRSVELGPDGASRGDGAGSSALSPSA
jgi:DNA primase